MFDTIPNESLTEKHLPKPIASWYEISTFALTFDGYTVHGSFDACADIANDIASTYADENTLPDDMTMLRTALFFEQRRWHHFGRSPDEEALIYIRALVERLHAIVAD